jgi:catechol 2,3-dioxygenase-like lactoylglutathione lyase family enzyme
MKIRYAHTNIIAKDWRKLVDFYTEVFHCVPVPPERDQSGAWLEKGTGVRNAALQGMHLRLPGHGLQGPTLEIYSYSEMIPQKPSTANRQGLGHLAFEVSELEACVQKALDQGASKHGEISRATVDRVGTIHFIYIADPEGNIIELQQWE